MVNVTDGADVAVRFRPLKFSFSHFSNLLFRFGMLISWDDAC